MLQVANLIMKETCHHLKVTGIIPAGLQSSPGALSLPHVVLCLRTEPDPQQHF